MSEPTLPTSDTVFTPTARVDMDGQEFYDALRKDYATLLALENKKTLSGKLKQYKNNLWGFLRTFEKGLFNLECLEKKMRSKALQKVDLLQAKLTDAEKEVADVHFEIRDKKLSFITNMKSRHSHFFPKDD